LNECQIRSNKADASLGIRFVLSRVDKHSEYIKGAGEKGDIKNQAIGTGEMWLKEEPRGHLLSSSSKRQPNLQ